MNLNNDDQIEDVDEHRKRLYKSIEEIDEIKNQVKKCNNQLFDDLEFHRRELSNILDSGSLSIEEAEKIYDLKEKIYRMEIDREYEYESYIKGLDNKNENLQSQIEEIDLEESNEKQKNKEE